MMAEDTPIRTDRQGQFRTTRFPNFVSRPFDSSGNIAAQDAENIRPATPLRATAPAPRRDVRGTSNNPSGSPAPVPAAGLTRPSPNPQGPAPGGGGRGGGGSSSGNTGTSASSGGAGSGRGGAAAAGVGPGGAGVGSTSGGRGGGSSSSSASSSGGSSGGGSSGGGCFITTAVCRTYGLPDDCYELRSMRWMRDNVLSRTEIGQRMVDRYYKIAPEIVDAIEASADPDREMREIAEKHLRGIFEAFERRWYERCIELYTEMVADLGHKWLPGSEIVDKAINIREPCNLFPISETLFPKGGQECQS